jgi:exosortase
VAKRKSPQKSTRKRRSKTWTPVGELAPKQEVAAPKPEELLSMPSEGWWVGRFLPAMALFSLVLIYAYWPTLVWMVDAWRKQPDYSHGFLVIPLACLILYHRSESFPGFTDSPKYMGLSLVVLSILMRFAGRMIYADFLDAWSMIPLIAGVTWFLWGFKAMRWALPAIAFLFFMFPMPYQAESLLSWKLQGVATQLSTVMLRVLGQPAVSESHVVWIGVERLLIEQACSGLRIFVGVGALAFFWAAVSDRSWIDRLVILASAIPLAIVANSIRITVTGVLYGWFTDASARNQIHDLTGFAMIPLAFGMLWGLKTFWEHLYRPVSQLTAKDFLTRGSKPVESGS